MQMSELGMVLDGKPEDHQRHYNSYVDLMVARYEN